MEGQFYDVDAMAAEIDRLQGRCLILQGTVEQLCRLLDRCRWELQWAADNNQLRQAVVLALVEYDRREETTL